MFISRRASALFPRHAASGIMSAPLLVPVCPRVASRSTLGPASPAMFASITRTLHGAATIQRMPIMTSAMRGFITWAGSFSARSGLKEAHSALPTNGFIGTGARMQQVAWTSVKRKRVAKMNKHKLQKLRKRYRMQSKAKNN
mmetsp:Transcript_80376/g.160449  ORF Transcript_80376/g.160449 Transcript_80376/m.160449 type:complete len:142 (-) Transcript_80376:261-686(-)